MNAKLVEILKERSGHDSSLPLQEEVIPASGAGESTCLPSLSLSL